MRVIALLAAACGSLLAAGCGGGGAGSVSHPLTSSTRSYQLGDQWQYTVTGIARSGDQSVPIGGRWTYAIVTRTVAGQDHLALSTSATLTGNGVDVELNGDEMFVQDAASGDVATVAEQVNTDPVRVVTSSPPPVTQPGTWTSSTAGAYTTSYSDGSTRESTFTTAGTAVVYTGAGGFDTWKVQTTDNDSLYGQSTTTEYWYPALGVPARIVLHQVNPDGSVVDATLTLQSTNVTLP